MLREAPGQLTNGVDTGRNLVQQLKVVVVGEFSLSQDEAYLVDSTKSACELPVIRELLQGADREMFLCIHLSTKNRVISWEVVAIGSLDSSVVHPRELFKGAILANAASVILVHNHPSGDPTPSRADVRLTGRMVEAGEILGISVLDHVVCAGGRTMSLRERNEI